MPFVSCVCACRLALWWSFFLKIIWRSQGGAKRFVGDWWHDELKLSDIISSSHTQQHSLFPPCSNPIAKTGRDREDTMTAPVAKSYFKAKIELGENLKGVEVGSKSLHCTLLIWFVLTSVCTNYSMYCAENEFENQYSDVCNYNRIHFWDQRYLDDQVLPLHETHIVSVFMFVIIYVTNSGTFRVVFSLRSILGDCEWASS